MYALQLARRAAPHATLVAVASPKHAHFLRAAPYSADIVLDYRDAGWPDAVVARGGAHYALDCISEGGTVARVHSALADAARLAVFRGPVGGGYDPHLRVAPVYGAVWEGLGVEVGYNDSTLPASPAARAFAAAFNAYLTTHPLINNPVRLLPGGLSRVVEDGFALLGGAKVADRAMSGVRPISGEKVLFELVNED
jgi:NADPH:quinone reductase-like Zn-dependent oxidoreductase